MRKNILVDEFKIKKMYLEEKMTTREVAKELGISPSTAFNRCRKLGIMRSDGTQIRDMKKYLLSKVKKNKNGCWEYSTFQDNGYCRIQYKGRMLKVHRVSYQVFNGEIPEGFTIDHICRVRSCINPDHLEAITQKENVLRGIGPTAINARKTHCIRGHKLEGENLFFDKGRQCVECRKIRYYKRKK